jgi:DDE superfamily endonuclease
MQTPNCRSGIKKTEGPQTGCGRRFVGGRRSSLPAIWISLPHVDCSGSGRPHGLAPSHTQECRLLRSRSTARWQAGLPAATPETKIQRRNLLRISQTSQTMCQPFGAASRRDCGQRYLSSCTTSQTLARFTRGPFPTLLLPPYSPELNPIERVWKLTRRKCLHNQHFSTLDQVVETVEQQFQLWGKANSTLTTLCAIT